MKLFARGMVLAGLLVGVVGRQNVSRDEKRGAPGRSGPEYDPLWSAKTPIPRQNATQRECL